MDGCAAYTRRHASSRGSNDEILGNDPPRLRAASADLADCGTEMGRGKGAERQREKKSAFDNANALQSTHTSYSLGESALLSDVEPALDLSSVALFVAR